MPVAADPVKGTVDERLDKIEAQLRTITELLKGKKDSQGFPLSSDPGLVKDVKKLTDDLAQLKADIESGKKSTSLRPVAPAPAPAKNTFTTGKGIVRIQNEYPVEITIAINSVTYRVAAEHGAKRLRTGRRLHLSVIELRRQPDAREGSHRHSGSRQAANQVNHAKARSASMGGVALAGAAGFSRLVRSHPGG